MLIFRYLSKEVCVTLVALTAILMLIFMSNQVVIYMNRAASGNIPGMLIMKLMLLELPNLLSLLLPLGFYVALLLAYGRLYAESEMTVLQACGYGPGKLLQHSLIMALVVAVVTSGMMLASPWIAYQRAKVLQTTGIQTLIQTLLPGRFRSLPGSGNQVFYVEYIRPDHLQAKNIFFARTTEQSGMPQWDVIWAEQALLNTDPQTHEDHVILINGKKYQGQPGSSAYQVARFESYKHRLPHPDQSVKNDLRTEKFRALWPMNNPDLKKAAELQWRLSVPLMVFVLTLVAVPLSRVNPRSGKYAKLLPAILLYIFYANFMFIARDWIISGKIPWWIGMGWLHLMVAMIGVTLMFLNARR